MKKLLALAVALVALSVAGAPAARALITEPSVTVAGAVRCTSGHWAPINDDHHKSVGIYKVVVVGDELRIYHARMDPVGSMQITADVDYAKAGITVPGASVGTTYSNVTFFKDGRVINPRRACQPWTNLWVTGTAVKTS